MIVLGKDSSRISYCFQSFKFSIVILLDWLPTKNREPSKFCYLIHRGRRDWLVIINVKWMQFQPEFEFWFACCQPVVFFLFFFSPTCIFSSYQHLFYGSILLYFFPNHFLFFCNLLFFFSTSIIFLYFLSSFPVFFSFIFFPSLLLIPSFFLLPFL